MQVVHLPIATESIVALLALSLNIFLESVQKFEIDNTLLTIGQRLFHALTLIKGHCPLLIKYLIAPSFTLNDRKPWPVLAWARFRLLSDTCTIENAITLSTSDRFERRSVILPVEHEPLVVPK